MTVVTAGGGVGGAAGKARVASSSSSCSTRHKKDTPQGLLHDAGLGAGG